MGFRMKKASFLARLLKSGDRYTMTIPRNWVLKLRLDQYHEEKKENKEIPTVWVEMEIDAV
jgi:hypothetical protein